MKKILISILVTFAALHVTAQFIVNGTNIYSNNTGVGIGVTTPAARLQVIGNAIIGQNVAGANAARLDITSGASNQDAKIDFGYYSTFDASILTIGRWADGSFRVSDYSGGSEVNRFFINTSGYVGIGTTSPTAMLMLKSTGATNSTTGLLVENSAGTDALRVLDNGHVGIGTTPLLGYYQTNAKLGVFADPADATGATIVLQKAIHTGYLGGIRFASTTVNPANSNIPYWSGIEAYGTGGTDQMDLRFFTSFSPSQQNQERMRIDQFGKIGIGTTTPSVKVDIVGTGGSTVDLQTTGRARIKGSSPGIWLNDLSADRALIGWAGSGIPNQAVGVYTTTGGWNTFNVMTNGSVAIGGQAPDANAKLDVTGNIYCNSKIFIGIADANTTTQMASYALGVNGTAIFNKAKVKLYGNWPDYVFDDDYKLMPLAEVEKFVKENKHLPEVPTAAETKKEGVDLGDNQSVLLKKVEELTLYIINQNKSMEVQQKQLEDLKNQLDKLKNKY